MRNRISFLDFNKALKDFPIFSTEDVFKIFPNLDSRRLYEWKKKGLIKSIVKGYYFFEETLVDEYFLYYVSNSIYSPSYVSLYSAFNWYGFIPEFVPQIVSVTTRKTATFDTSFGKFTYFSIKEPLMFGYNLIINPGKTPSIRMASPEKALLDLLYLNPQLDSTAHFKELRLNTFLLKEKIRLDVLEQYLQLFSSEALSKRVFNFMEYLKNA